MDEASLLGGPTVSAFHHHSEDNPIVPAGPPDCLPFCLAQQDDPVRMDESSLCTRPRPPASHPWPHKLHSYENAAYGHVNQLQGCVISGWEPCRSAEVHSSLLPQFLPEHMNPGTPTHYP